MVQYGVLYRYRRKSTVLAVRYDDEWYEYSYSYPRTSTNAVRVVDFF